MKWYLLRTIKEYLKEKTFKIDTKKLELDLSEQKQNLINIIKEIENRKSKYNEAKEEVKLAKEEIRILFF